MNKRVSVGVLVGGATLLMAGPSAHAAPITFNTALPVSEGHVILRGQGHYLRATDDPSPMDRELEVWAAPTVLVYGLTEKAALFGIVPYLDKRMKVNTPVGRRTREVSGLGDSTLLGRYTVKQWDRAGETLRIAPFAGLKFPTGDDDETDDLGRLPQPLQLGSGSWDPFVGSVFTWQTLDWQFDTSLSYRFNTEANNFELGDELEWNNSFQYRLWPWDLAEAGVPGFFYGVLESNVVWQDRNEQGGQTIADSGGTRLYLTPGLQYVRERWIVEAAVQIPVAQDLNGEALEEDVRVTGGFRWNF